MAAIHGAAVAAIGTEAKSATCTGAAEIGAAAALAATSTGAAAIVAAAR